MIESSTSLKQTSPRIVNPEPVEASLWKVPRAFRQAHRDTGDERQPMLHRPSLYQMIKNYFLGFELM